MENSNVHELIIFNRSGLCLYHHDLNKSKLEGDLAGLLDCERPSKEIINKQKLIYGLLWSLKSYAQMVSCDALGQQFKNFSTPQYSFHFFEVPTGVKIVLLTNPTSTPVVPTVSPTSPFSLPHLC